MAKPERMWGVTYTNCQARVLPESIRSTREEAIKAFVDPRKPVNGQSDWRFAWSEWKKRGCRAVRITVSVEEPTP